VALADIVFVAVPPAAVIEVLEVLRPRLRKGTVVTDCTSVKSEVAKWASQTDATWFIPGHPMAGHEKGGPQFASAWLFRGATWLICPLEQKSTAVPIGLSQLIKEMGAAPVMIDAESHDHHVAVLSHLPHILSAILATKAASLAFPAAAGGSFRDWTRVAGVDPQLWSQILAGNRSAVVASIRALGSDLSNWADHLEAGNDLVIRDHFEAATKAKARLEPSKVKSSPARGQKK
jgi:prephenate dehydrogenase